MSNVVVHESKIAGLGVFTARAVRVGDIVCGFELGREVSDDAPLVPTEGERPEHCCWIDGRVFLVGPPERHINHACDPSVFKRFDEDGIVIVARRDLDSGDELTLDYLINNPGGDSWDCACGAGRCRGRTGTSYFDLPAELRREYRPLLAPWFVERFAERLRRLDGDLASSRGPAQRPPDGTERPA